MTAQEHVYIPPFTDYVYGLLGDAQFDELRQVPSVTLAVPRHRFKWGHIHHWCNCEVGEENYTWAGARFYFKYEKDAVLFALRWL